MVRYRIKFGRFKFLSVISSDMSITGQDIHLFSVMNET